MVLMSNASGIAAKRLAECSPRRFSHVRGVAGQAERIAAVVGADGELLVAAAWLHDIGYAPELADAGFHPLDGARFLRRQGADGRLCGLVAHHSCSVIEAEMRGLADELLAEFPREESAISDALIYCDLTTGPDGQRLTAEERLAEIISRYGPDSLVGRFIDQARSEMIDAVRRTEERLRAAGIEH
ncbi:MAG TPA: HD domain-containing protein [Propionibacteriaceae bacterium]